MELVVLKWTFGKLIPRQVLTHLTFVLLMVKPDAQVTTVEMEITDMVVFVTRMVVTSILSVLETKAS